MGQGPHQGVCRLEPPRPEEGYRIASSEDSRQINFYRYVAWLVDRKNTPNEAPLDYESVRADAARRSSERSLEGRDIGELPAVENQERKESCRNDFKLFCETYLPEVYQLKCSDDHLRAIAKIQKSVLEGGLFALAMSRGSGKSSLTETAAIWAMLYGHREFTRDDGEMRRAKRGKVAKQRRSRPQGPAR